VKDKDFFFLETLLPAEQARARQAMGDATTLEEKRTRLLNNLIDGPWFPWNYESDASTTARLKPAVRKIGDRLRSENLGDGELLIVCHAGT
jgi:broad specificity phosphatase PhoE